MTYLKNSKQFCCIQGFLRHSKVFIIDGSLNFLERLGIMIKDFTIFFF